VTQRGFLLIADLTGYTMFLTSSELEHAQGVLDALFKSIFAEIKAPIVLSNLQGDAALAHLPEASVPQRQFPLDAIERIYCSFANTLGAMRLNTTCTCNACRNMGSLDLKFFLHHGEYAMQNLAGRTELQGPEVIRIHRLMKNSVSKTTGIKAYALVTQQAADAIGLPDFFASAIRQVEHNDEFGDTVCHVYDLAPVFARWRALRRVFVERGEPLAFESMELDLPVPPAVAWAYVTDVEKKIRWQQGLDGMTMTGLADGRVAAGAVQHCAHGKGSTMHEIVDWRPFDYVTWHIGTPMGTVARQTAEFTPLDNGGTHLSLRSAKVESANALAQRLVRLMMPLVAARKLAETQRASKAALQRLVADDLAASGAGRETAA
jgi:carbon monoxide dehydrogenase subunit G